jgi:hypothetical protein
VKNCGWITYWHISKERSNTSRVTWGEAAKEQRLPNFARDLEIGKHGISISVYSQAQIHAHYSNVTINLLAMYLALISVY